jgi:hypothetical protein
MTGWHALRIAGKILALMMHIRIEISKVFGPDFPVLLLSERALFQI